MSSFQFTIFADYFQVYLEDENAHPDLSQSWTPIAVENLIAFDPDCRRGFGIGTVRNMPVPVTVDILHSAPTDSDLSEWDQVNECSIEIISGKLIILGCTDYYPEAARILVQPGTYRARICYGNLDTLSEDGLEGSDHYKVILWPAPYQEPAILKKRRP